jgi:putative transposase
MCEFAWENGKAERINGIIKNNYLKHRNINSYEQLVKEVDRSVSLYNHDKPHIKLKRLSPIAFENKILHLSSSLKESRSINNYNYAEHS